MKTNTEINEDNQQKQQDVSGHVEPVVSEIIAQLKKEVRGEIHYKARSFQAIHDTAQAFMNDRGLLSDAAIQVNHSVDKFTNFEMRLIKLIDKLSR
jgi:hypothetical protein